MRIFWMNKTPLRMRTQPLWTVYTDTISDFTYEKSPRIWGEISRSHYFTLNDKDGQRFPDGSYATKMQKLSSLACPQKCKRMRRSLFIYKVKHATSSLELEDKWQYILMYNFAHPLERCYSDSTLTGFIGTTWNLSDQAPFYEWLIDKYWNPWGLFKTNPHCAKQTRCFSLNVQHKSNKQLLNYSNLSAKSFTKKLPPGSDWSTNWLTILVCPPSVASPAL